MMTFKKIHDDGLTAFDDVKVGSVFVYENIFYIRIKGLCYPAYDEYVSDKWYGAICLADGTPEEFEGDERVKVVKSCELTVEF